jgi:hypothetical protein
VALRGHRDVDELPDRVVVRDAHAAREVDEVGAFAASPAR